MLERLKAWYRKLRGRDVCKRCQTKLDEWGYCDPCNDFPYRRWITDAEDLWLTEVQFMRDHPDEYARQEKDRMRTEIKYQLRNPVAFLSRDKLILVYGKELVESVEQELKLKNDLEEQ